MENHSIRNGILFGMAAVSLNLIFYFTSPKFMMGFGSWLIYLMGLYFMVMAVQSFKTQNEGYISLAEAFKAAWLTFVIGITMSGIFSFVLYNYIDIDLLDMLRESQIEALQKMAAMLNMDAAAVESAKIKIEDQNPFSLKSFALAMPVSYLFPGAIFAIIIAAVLKKVNEFA